MLDAAFLEGVNSPDLRSLAVYWARQGGDRLPARADIDPLDFVPLLGNVFLIDVIREPAPDFRFRLFGSEMAQTYGRDLTGRHLSELREGDFASALRAEYEQVVESACPSLRRGQLEWPGRGHIGYERLILPLAADGERVDMLLGATIYDLPRLPNRWIAPR